MKSSIALCVALLGITVQVKGQLPPQPDIKRSVEAYKRCVDAGRLPLFPPDPKSEWNFDTRPGFTGGPNGGPAGSDWLKAGAWDEKRLPSLGADLSDAAARIIDAKMAAIGAAESRTWDGWVWAQNRFVKPNDNGTWTRVMSNWCVESLAVEWSENSLVKSSDTVIEITREESAQYVKDIAEGRSPVTDMWAWPHVLYKAINRKKEAEEKGEELLSRLVNAHWALSTITQRKVTTLIPPIAYGGSDPNHNSNYFKRLQTVLSRVKKTPVVIAFDGNGGHKDWATFWPMISYGEGYHFLDQFGRVQEFAIDPSVNDIYAIFLEGADEENGQGWIFGIDRREP